MKKEPIIVSKEFHLNRAKEFQHKIDTQPFISSTEKVTLERLRDQRIRLAELTNIITTDPSLKTQNSHE